MGRELRGPRVSRPACTSQQMLIVIRLLHYSVIFMVRNKGTSTIFMYICSIHLTPVSVVIVTLNSSANGHSMSSNSPVSKVHQSTDVCSLEFSFKASFNGSSSRKNKFCVTLLSLL